MKHLAFIPFWESQILIHIMIMFHLGEALITQEQDTKTVLLKIWVLLITLSTISDVIRRIVFLIK